jgi:photosystem II stability/assembly factor-like uncharacterized protein
MPFRWNPTNAPSASSRTDDIWFLNERVGWAVNSDGKALFTSDGGDSWTVQQQFPPRTYLRCVSFADDRTGWIGTTTGANRLYVTRDAGGMWSPVIGLPPQPTAICGLHAVSDSVVYAAGTNWPDRPTSVLKSVDAGHTWSQIDTNHLATILVDIFFFTPQRGWVVGGAGGRTRPRVKPVILYTEDGGASWVNQLAGRESEFPFGEWGWKIQFLDDQTGFVSLENFDAGAILRTEDGGRTWTRHPVNDAQGNANLEGIGFIDRNRGWVGGWGDREFKGGYTSETANGGDTWMNANHVGKFLNRFRFIGTPPFVGYASGDTVYKYSEVPESVAKTLVRPRITPRELLLEEPEYVTVGELSLLINVPARSRHLTVEVWDRFSAHVATVVDQSDPSSGLQTVAWKFRDSNGRPLSAGHYIYRVTVDDRAESRIVFNAPLGSSSGGSGGGGARAADDGNETIAALQSMLSATTLQTDQPPPLPTVEQEKEAFHRIANIEDYPAFRAIAKALAYAYLRNADYSEPLYVEFEYTLEAFDRRMRDIYDQYVPGMYGSHRYDREIVQWSNGKRYRIGRASDAVVKDRLLQLAPFNLMDGVWLQTIMEAGPSDAVKARLFDIWADEVGNGESRENHSNVYQDLLRNLGMYLPSTTSREFLDLDLAPGAWRSPVFQMSIGLFPQEFLPELLGMTLFLEWEATPTLNPTVRMLRGRGINPLFYALHVAIDNISEGHGAIAKEAVQIYLDERRAQGGERAVQESWKRIWNGYVAWATAGFNGAGLEERRLIIDRKTINLGTKEAPDCFPKWNTYYKDRMIGLVRRKAPYASQVHGRAMLDGSLLNDLFNRPEELMAKLLASGFVNVTKPRDSKLFDLMRFEGPMYRVFTDEDKDIILDWIESLSPRQEQCIDPIEDPSGTEPSPTKMARLIADFAGQARRAHDGLTLPNEQCQPTPLVDYLTDPAALMASLVRSGFVIPGAPDRSMFLTRILENGGPMEGVFDADGVNTVRQWIAEGARPPSGSDEHPSAALASGSAREPLTLADLRPFIGQGSVH